MRRSVIPRFGGMGASRLERNRSQALRFGALEPRSFLSFLVMSGPP